MSLDKNGKSRKTSPSSFVSKAGEGKCALPSPNGQSIKCRLGETVSSEAAETACSHVKEGHGHEQCVYAVIATGDIGAAQAGAF